MQWRGEDRGNEGRGWLHGCKWGITTIVASHVEATRILIVVRTASVREGAMRGESLWEVRGREWGNKLVIRSGIQWAVGLHILIGTYILLLSRT